jgi:hypothetical protein
MTAGRGVSMRTWIKAAMLVTMLMLGVSAQITPAAAEAVAAKKAQAAGVSDVSARRYHRHERYAYRPNDPYPMYYRRPV